MSPAHKGACHPARSPALFLSRPAAAGRARDAERDLLSAETPRLLGIGVLEFVNRATARFTLRSAPLLQACRILPAAGCDLSRLSLRPLRLCGKQLFLSQIFLRLFSVTSVLNLLPFSAPL